MIFFADIFSGCGGLTYGFSNNPNFKGILAVDNWTIAGEVYELNYPDIPFKKLELYLDEDVKMVVSELKDRCDLLLGGPPCQGFSTLGKRSDNDIRSSLIQTYLDICFKVKPKIILLENVLGIKSKKYDRKHTYSEKIIEILSNGTHELGYNIKELIINTLDYGLAQTRKRWFLIGIRKNIENSKEILGEIINDIYYEKRKKTNTLKDVISDLPKIDSGEGKQIFTQIIDGEERIIYNHEAMNHTSKLKRRLQHVPVGGGLLDVPRELLTDHLKRMVDGVYGNGGHIKNIYGRLVWEKPCGTIVAGIDKITCGRFVHPDFNRLLTPRECARIQSFPDDFVFKGSKVNQYYLIGNAVPPRMSEIFANTIGNQIKRLE